MISREKYGDMLRCIKDVELKPMKARADYERVASYALHSVCCIEKLIMSRKNPDDPVRYFAPNKEFTILATVDILTGHGGQKRMEGNIGHLYYQNFVHEGKPN